LIRRIVRRFFYRIGIGLRIGLRRRRLGSRRFFCHAIQRDKADNVPMRQRTKRRECVGSLNSRCCRRAHPSRLRYWVKKFGDDLQGSNLWRQADMARMLPEGISCGLHRIERLMRLQALTARPRRRRLLADLGEPQVAAESRDHRASEKVEATVTGSNPPAWK
jgi:hypothetical protein